MDSSDENNKWFQIVMHVVNAKEKLNLVTAGVELIRTSSKATVLNGKHKRSLEGSLSDKIKQYNLTIHNTLI